ncbi:hypothetical protein [Streptomyces longwoodensis]|uniref:hypothetical protein n=1 Tax=Streptomyces longwoodensis TaxID=68231 RepID=UPI0033D01E6B
MTILAGKWYENVDVWTLIVTSLVALVVGWAGAWVAFRAANPKLRIDWIVRLNDPLIEPAHASSRITLQADGTPVTHPRIIEIQVSNSGRKDIVGSMFNDGESLLFDLGAPIITILDVEDQPAEGAPELEWARDGTSQVGIPPCHFARGRTVKYRFLVDGPNAPIKVVRQPLVDVNVRRDSMALVRISVGTTRDP